MYIENTSDLSYFYFHTFIINASLRQKDGFKLKTSFSSVSTKEREKQRKFTTGNMHI